MSVYTKEEIRRILAPLANSIISRIKKSRISGRTLIVGIQGGQGTGKTTLVTFLKKYLSAKGYRVEAFSIDDFYKTWKERLALARKYPQNPYYHISRGLPGTHRVELLRSVLQKLKAGKSAELPVFDKSLRHAQGDVSPATRKVRGRNDIILFEGWCLGLPVISLKELSRIGKKHAIPLKKLDPTRKHSAVVLRFLKEYQPLWKQIDYMIMLKPDSSRLHFQWRWQQEKELKKKTGRGMTKQQVERFVQPYLPFTYACYEKVKADAVLRIDKEHSIY